MFAYPALNAGLPAATGDPGWKVRGFGPFSLIDAPVGVATGEKEWASGISSFLSMGPLVDIFTKVLRNRDVWGREVVDHAASWQGKIIQGLEAVGEQFYPSQLLIQGIKAGTPNKAIAGVLGTTWKPPVDPVAKAKWDRRDERAALRREQKDPIETFIRSHLDMPLEGIDEGGGDRYSQAVARGERIQKTGTSGYGDVILAGAASQGGRRGRAQRRARLQRSQFGYSP